MNEEFTAEEYAKIYHPGLNYVPGYVDKIDKWTGGALIMLRKDNCEYCHKDNYCDFDSCVFCGAPLPEARSVKTVV